MLNLENAQNLNNQMIDAIRKYKPLAGEPTVLKPALEAGLRKHLRHEFIEKFSLLSQRERYRTPNEDGSLEEIYSNQPLMYIGKDGTKFNASSSEPSFIIHLLSLLDVQPGHRVLEVGCGTGWLLSLIGELVGENGHACGIEIIPELAKHASKVVHRKGISNINIIEGDANQLNLNEKFDKVIFTTSAYFFPNFLWECVKENGIVVIPMRNRGPAEEVLQLSKKDDEFRLITSRFCKFVEMTGKYSFHNPLDNSGIKDIPKDENILDLFGKEIVKQPLFFDKIKDPNNRFHLPFSSFMSKTEPNFNMYRMGQYSIDMNNFGQSVYGDLPTLSMFIIDEEKKSMAVWRNHELTAYGGEKAYVHFLDKFDEWVELGCPSGVSFSLTISKQENLLPHIKSKRKWLELRGDDYFLWSL